MQKRNFNKKDITNEIYKKLGFSKNFSSGFIDTFLESIISEVIKNDKIKITSFGTFKVLKKKERLGRNPKTKEKALITSRKTLKFSASSLFRKKLNE
tara:strand:- start:45 stop:335 length:291 start_codon:yes stop_codon:yes gene_type:complete